MSFYSPESPLSKSGSGGSVFRAETPLSSIKARAGQVPVYSRGSSARPSLHSAKVPPSSYRDSPSSRAPSRSVSRAGNSTPSLGFVEHSLNVYVPTNPKDPLDAEVAAIINSIPHGILVERVDPPLKTIPKDGEEIRATYAFSNSLSRKTVTCRLTTLTRSGGKANGEATAKKKVMCRVGGGWQDLQLYMLNRQAGM